jgi:hypothetical protein
MPGPGTGPLPGSWETLGQPTPYKQLRVPKMGVLWNLKIYFNFSKIAPLFIIQSHKNRIYIFRTLLPKYLIKRFRSVYAVSVSLFYLHRGLRSGLFPSGISTKILCAFPIFPLLDTFPVHLVPLDFTSLTKYVAKRNNHGAVVVECSPVYRYCLM